MKWICSKFLSRRILTMAGLAVWLGALVFGFGLLHVYMGTPGARGSAPGDSPSIETRNVAAGQARVLMFVHPHCPCSRASLDELHKAVTTATEPVGVDILLVKPVGVEAGWEQGISARMAATIPGVQIRPDDGGLLARQYGAATSGHVVFYDRSGKLRFSGGLTRSRGHAGDNAGARALTALLTGLPAEISSTPVYGCPLMRAGERELTGALCGSPLESRRTP